jgi:hypothetical protein
MQNVAIDGYLHELMASNPGYKNPVLNTAPKFPQFTELPIELQRKIYERSIYSEPPQILFEGLNLDKNTRCRIKSLGGSHTFTNLVPIQLSLLNCGYLTEK